MDEERCAQTNTTFNTGAKTNLYFINHMTTHGPGPQRRPPNPNLVASHLSEAALDALAETIHCRGAVRNTPSAGGRHLNHQSHSPSQALKSSVNNNYNSRIASGPTARDENFNRSQQFLEDSLSQHNQSFFEQQLAKVLSNAGKNESTVV